MKIGLWNIDHPEDGSGSLAKQRRFDAIKAYLEQADCEVYIVTEANAAIGVSGYKPEFSSVSPFKTSRRFYGSPNVYHQVAIYSKIPYVRKKVSEPVNGLRIDLVFNERTLVLYGNVITIKDQWSKASVLKYSDRLNEQIEAIRDLPDFHTLVGGDFNLRRGWSQKKFAYQRVKAELEEAGWLWPTEEREDTVQHVMHTRDLQVSVSLDFSVKYDDKRSLGLSDHPFVELKVHCAEVAEA